MSLGNLVSVYMTVYNGEKFLFEAINSILNQTYKNFNFIIVNDGSTDSSEAIIKSFTDSRIQYISNSSNKGIVYSRNRALKEIKTKYTAVLDCDDISEPTRLEKQLHFMESNPEVAVCGTWAVMIDEKSTVFGHKIMPVANKDFVNIEMLFRNQFVHSSTFFRTKIALESGGYQLGCEDFWLFSKISLNHKMANLPEFLTQYRIHSSNISETNKVQINQNELDVVKMLYSRFNIDEKYLNIPLSIIKNDFSLIDNSLVYGFFTTMIDTNNQNLFYEKSYFNSIMFQYWYEIILNNKIKTGIFRFYLKSKKEKINFRSKQIKKIFKHKFGL
jgi:glycosyltransferase involved in cell wall biosynthesis